jgi:hypothetical protein
MAGSSGRTFVSEIEKDAIQSAAIEHNREIPLIIHQLIQSSFLCRATHAKSIRRTHHVDPGLYMHPNKIKFRSSQTHGSGRERRVDARRGCTRQASIIGSILHNNINISIINDHENEQYQEQSRYNDDQQWEDEATMMKKNNMKHVN